MRLPNQSSYTISHRRCPDTPEDLLKNTKDRVEEISPQASRRKKTLPGGPTKSIGNENRPVPQPQKADNKIVRPTKTWTLKRVGDSKYVPK